MRCQLAIIVGVLLVCSFLAYCAPHGNASLKASALRAFEGSFRAMVSPGLEVRTSGATGGVGLARCGAASHTFPPEQRSAGSDKKRLRVTPYQAKRVAAAQGWRCGCGCIDPRDPQRRGLLLDETFEIDHVRATRFGGAHEPSNWVAILRSHHQLKSAMESQAAALHSKRSVNTGAPKRNDR